MEATIEQTKQASVLVNQVVTNEYTLYLNDVIDSVDQYMDHIHIFKTASSDDVILLDVTSRGGQVAVSEQYISEMNKSAALIVAIVGMGVASAASAICLAADDLVVTEMGTMLIHSFSSGSQGTAGEMYKEAEFNKALNERWLEKRFGEFLTEEEKSDVLKGVDLVFNAEEIEERWVSILESRHGLSEESGSETSPQVIH